MNDWKDGFLAQVLSNVPEGRYRDRLTGELSGHLDALAADLEAGGLASEEAHALALEKMGDREDLQRSCRDEYRRREANDPLRCAGALLVACIVTCAVSVPIFFLIVPYAADHAYVEYGISSYVMTAFAWSSTFLPLLAGEACLRPAFRDHRRPRLMITLGLLLSCLSLVCMGAGGDILRHWSVFGAGHTILELLGWTFDHLRFVFCGTCMQPLCVALVWLFVTPQKGTKSGGATE